MPDSDDEYTVTDQTRIGTGGSAQHAYIVCPNCEDANLVNNSVTLNSVLMCPECRSVFEWRPAIRELSPDELQEEYERMRKEKQSQLDTIEASIND